MSDTEFRRWIENQIISKNGYIADTCTCYQANEIMKELLEERIKKHPILWKLFFMIA